MSQMSRRFVLAGAVLTTASLLVPITVRRPRAAAANGVGGLRDHRLDHHRAERGGHARPVAAGSRAGLLHGAAANPRRRARRRLGAGQGPVRDRQAGLQDRVPAGGARAEGGRLDVDHGALRAPAHRRRRRARGARPRRGAAMEHRRLASAAPRTASSSTRAASGCPTASLRARSRQAAAQRRAAAQGPQPVSPDRQAGGAAGYAGQVRRQRGLRHRRRGARNAQRRHQDGAVLHRAGDRDQERGRYSQDARRARRGEARRRWRSPTRTAARSIRACRMRRATTRSASSPIISGRPSARSMSLDVEFDRGSAGDLSSAKIDAMLDAALDAEQGVTALVRGQPREILQERAASVIERRFVLPHIAHAPLEPVNATASYKRRRGRGLGTDPVGHGVPGGGRACGRLLRRRREGERHVSRRQLRPQDRPGLRAAGRARLQGGRASGQAHALARGGHAARRLPAERRRPLARGRSTMPAIRWRCMRASPASRCSAPRAGAGSTRRRRAPGTRAWSTASTIRATGCRISWWRRSTRRCRSRSISCARSARPRRCSSGRA